MELEGLPLVADAAVSHQSLIHRSCDEHQEHAFAHKFRDLIMLADVASSITTTAATLLNHDKKKKKKKQKTKQDRLTPKSSLSNSWSLQVHENSNLKLRLNKISKTTLVSSSVTQTSSNPSLSSHPIDLLPHVAFAYKTSTLWALSANTIPTKKRSTYNRRPNRGFKPVPTTPIAGTKRSFVEIDNSRKEPGESHCQNYSNKRRRVTLAVLPDQLSNYLATKKAVTGPHF